jgi:hypothetical protein
MTTTELLNKLVTTMVEKKGYAYTTGYLQSTILTMMSHSTASQVEQDANRSDLQYALDRLVAESA